MTAFPKADVLAACAEYGKLLRVSSDLDGIRVMTALASNESSLGANCGPRYEPSYDLNGRNCNHQMVGLIALYGRDACCSYGPWQMMYVNFTAYTPTELLTDLQACSVEFVRFFNSYVIGVRKAVTLADVGEVWNLGHEGPDPEYVAKLQAAYDAAKEVA